MTEQSEFRLKIEHSRNNSEDQWYIVRKVVKKRCWFLPNSIKWVPLTCAEVGYPRRGRHEPTDVRYFFDDYCANAALLNVKLNT